MLTKIIFFPGKQGTVRILISWKHSLGRLSEEYELTRKKKQALGSLLDAGKISQSTHSLFAREIDEAVAEIDGQRRALVEKMTSKAMELQEQIRMLEILLANFEIQHVTGEVSDDTYNRETELLSTGLETSKKELDDVQTAVNQLSNDDLLTQQTEQSQIQTSGNPAEPSEETPQTLEKEQGRHEEAAVEKIQCGEETQAPAKQTKTEEQRQT
jgi:hypothetical protein